MDVAVFDSSVAGSIDRSSVEGSALVSSQSSGDEVAPGAVDQDRVVKTTTIKKRRTSVRKPRTKGILKKIQDQVEFYFGDANLPKDKFLQQKMRESADGYVSVDVVASFKKMQLLTKDTSLVIKAIKNSTLVELSPDLKSLRRCNPLPDISQSEVDLRTVYVENLSLSTTDHESISKNFKVFGEIKYISLPRYKTSGDIKGFAFVEFSSKEAAAKAVEYFRIKDTLPVTQRKRKPSKVMASKEAMETTEKIIASEKTEMVDVASEKIGEDSVGTGTVQSRREDEEMVGEGEGEQRRSKRAREDDTMEEKGRQEEGVRGKEGEMVGETKKRTREEDREEDGAKKRLKLVKEKEMKGKRKRAREEVSEQEQGGEVDTPNQADKSISVPPKKRTKLETKPQDGTEKTQEERGVMQEEARKEVMSGEEMSAAQEGEQGAKKKKNRQHRKKQWASTVKDLNLRVMSKVEWLGMKSLFKDLQKSHMKKVKTEMKPLGDDIKPPSRSRGFVMDCLVRVELKEKWEESQRDRLKDFCAHHGDVAYVDMKEGDLEGFVRFRESGCIGGLLQSTDKPSGMTFSAVNEEGERAYYLKTQAEKKQMFKDKKKLKQRGQEKLASRALKKTVFEGVKPKSETIQSTSGPVTHIKFSDSEQSDTECS